MSVMEVNPHSEIVHYEKNGDARLFPASMTKVMSVYVALSHLDNLDEKVTLQNSDLAGLHAANASMAGFTVGETVSIYDLLYGSILMSGAEATRTLARLVSGDETRFVELMNETAQDLGMKNTHFVNTSGLHDDEHYTTANDLLLLLKAALSNPTLKEMMSTMTYRTDPTNVHPYGLTFNNTLIAYSQLGNQEIGHIVGGKTGWTPEAGYCLASFADFEDKTVIVVSADGYDYGVQLKDHNAIYSELFESTHLIDVFAQDEVLGQVSLNYSNSLQEFQLTSDEEITLELPKIVSRDDLTIEVNAPETMEAPIEEDTLMGDVEVSYGNETLYETEFRTSQLIERDNIEYYMDQFIHWISTPVVYLTILFSLLVLIVIMLLVRIIRRKKRYGSRSHRYTGRRKNQWRL